MNKTGFKKVCASFHLIGLSSSRGHILRNKCDFSLAGFNVSNVPNNNKTNRGCARLILIGVIDFNNN